jgi:hypothetical protein
MNAYIFVSTTHANLRAFTSDETGGKLPAGYAPWSLTWRMYLASALDPIAAAVKEHGFFLVSS